MKVRIRISDNSMLDGVEDDDEKWEKDSSTKDEDASTPPPYSPCRTARVYHAGEEQGRKVFSNCFFISLEKSKSQ